MKIPSFSLKQDQRTRSPDVSEKQEELSSAFLATFCLFVLFTFGLFVENCRDGWMCYDYSSRRYQNCFVDPHSPKFKCSD